MHDHDISIIFVNGNPERMATPQRTAYESCPQFSMTILALVAPLSEPYDSTFFTTSMPAVTEPKTTCLPSSQLVWAVHRKNWLPFVFGPALAIDKMPGPVCGRVKFSSGKRAP